MKKLNGAVDALVHSQTKELKLPTVGARFGDLADEEALPDPVSAVPLFARHAPVLLQDVLDERPGRPQHRGHPLGPFSLWWHRRAERLPYRRAPHLVDPRQPAHTPAA